MNGSTYDDRLARNWDWAEKYFHRKCKEFKIVGWNISMDKPKKRIAQCNFLKKMVTISYHFLRGVSCNENKIRNAILHELAHVLTPGHHHDKVWKEMALKIGSDGKVAASMDLPDATWLMYCPNKCFKNCYYRKPKIENKYCLKCKASPLLKSLK